MKGRVRRGTGVREGRAAVTRPAAEPLTTDAGKGAGRTKKPVSRDRAAIQSSRPSQWAGGDPRRCVGNGGETRIRTWEG